MTAQIVSAWLAQAGNNESRTSMGQDTRRKQALFSVRPDDEQ